jgi:hypothetical protein
MSAPDNAVDTILATYRRVSQLRISRNIPDRLLGETNRRSTGDHSVRLDLNNTTSGLGAICQQLSAAELRDFETYLEQCGLAPIFNFAKTIERLRRLVETISLLRREQPLTDDRECDAAPAPWLPFEQQFAASCQALDLDSLLPLLISEGYLPPGGSWPANLDHRGDAAQQLQALAPIDAFAVSRLSGALTEFLKSLDPARLPLPANGSPVMIPWQSSLNSPIAAGSSQAAPCGDDAEGLLLNFSCRGLTRFPHAVLETILRQSTDGEIGRVIRALDLSHNLIEEILLTDVLKFLDFLDEQVHAVLESFVELNLAHNKLDQIPESLCMLTGLVTLDLSHNHLHKVPESLASCVHLKYFDISFNHISAIPPAYLGLL